MCIMKRISAWILTFCMLFICTRVCFSAGSVEDIIVGRDSFVGDSADWYESNNASGMHYNNAGIVSTTDHGRVSGSIEISLPTAGEYELFWFYSGWHADTGVLTITIPSSGGDVQRQISTNNEFDRGWQSIGTYNFSAGNKTISLLTNGNQVRISGLKAVYNNDYISISSELFTVDNGARTITGILKNMTVSEFLENITIPDGCSKSVNDKNNEDVVTTGDILKVEGDSIIEFTMTVDKDFILSDYTFSDTTISNIPYGTNVSDFLSNIIISNNVTAKVFTDGTENLTIVNNGDKLKIIATAVETEYTLLVIPASGNNTITSGVYTVSEDTISQIPYNTSPEIFEDNITIPEFATVTYPYPDDYDGYLYNGDVITVTAQNGDIKRYTLSVNAGRSESTLSANCEFIVSAQNGVISNVESGMNVSEFLSSLTASNGGRIKLYARDGSEKTTGKIDGTETVRVYPEYSQAGNNYDIYTVSCKLKRISKSDVIVTVEDDGYTYTGERNQSGSAVPPGYNGITTEYPFGGIGTFTPVITEAGNYEVQIYTSYHASNQKFNATVYYNGGSATVQVPQDDPISGWKSIGRYSFSEGSTGRIECDSTNNIMARLSAVRLIPEGGYNYVTSASLVVGDTDQQISEGVNRNKEYVGAAIKIDSDVELTADDIQIVSENSNPIDFTLVKENGSYIVTPKYNLRDNVTYQISVLSDELSKAYTYLLIGKEDVSATAEVRILAGRAYTILDIKNNTDSAKELTVLVCTFSNAFKMESCNLSAVTVLAGETQPLTNNVVTETSSANNVKIFIWDAEHNPVTKVYYR